MRYSIERKINPMNLIDQRYLIDPISDLTWRPNMGDFNYLSSKLNYKLTNLTYSKIKKKKKKKKPDKDPIIPGIIVPSDNDEKNGKNHVLKK